MLSIKFDLTNRLASNAQLAYDNSRFCILKFTKPAHEHHLQVGPHLASLCFRSFTTKSNENLTVPYNIGTIDYCFRATYNCYGLLTLD